ncbi:MAG: PAS domain S-box protein [Rhodothermales bacterium]|nr:PAS domain S-box protein [Rhodothermales bacterium]
MKQDEKNDGLFVWIGGFIVLVIFVAELLLPLGDAGGWLYIIGMVIILWMIKPDQVRPFGIACSVAAMLGFFFTADFTADSSEGYFGLVNRLMSVFAIGAVTLLTHRQAELEVEMRRQQVHLTSVVEKRTEGLKQMVDQIDEVKIRLTEAEELGRFGFWEYHPGTQEMIWSMGVFAIYGYPIMPKAPSMHEFLERCHTDDIHRLQQSIQFGMAEQKAYTVEYRIVLPDNSVRWIYNRGRPALDARGRIQMIVGTIQDITDRKVSEMESDEKYFRYTTIFHNAAVAKALIIPNKIILDANVALAQWVGYSLEELKRMPLEQLMHEDDRSMEDVYAREMIVGEIDFFQQEKRFTHKNGRELWGLFSVSAVHDSNDKVTSFAAEIIDITRRKEAETALRKVESSWRESEEALTIAQEKLRSDSTSQDDIDAALASRDEEIEKLQSLIVEFEETHAQSEEALSLAEDVVEYLFGVSGEMLCLIGVDGLYRRVSPLFEDKLGFLPDELEDRSLLEFLHAEDHKGMLGQFEKLEHDQAVARYGFRHRKKDGSYVRLTIDATPSKEHGVYYAVLREMAPARRPEAPARPKTDVRPLTDPLPFLIWILDKDRMCTYVNKKVRDFTGMPFEQLAGAGWSNGIVRTDFNRYLAYYNERFEHAEPMQIVYRYRRHDGVERWMQETCVPMTDAAGAFEGYVCTAIDISALKTVESQFSRAVQEAVDLSDLSSALQVCRRADNTTVLSDNVRIADALVEYASGISHEDLKALMHHAGQQLHLAIQSVLDFSCVRTMPASISHHKVLLEKVTARTLDLLQPLTSDGGPQFSVDVRLHDVMVLTDELMLHRILENLIRNLLPFTRTGMIGIEINADEDLGVVRIKDLGPVLPAAMLSNLADNYRKQGAGEPTLLRSAGLELSLAKRLVELLKGVLTIEDLPHRGIEFTMGFPLAEEVFPPVTGDALPEKVGRRQPMITRPVMTVAASTNHTSARVDVSRAAEQSVERPAPPPAPVSPEEPAGPRLLVAEANPEVHRIVRSLLQPYYTLTIATTMSSAMEQARLVTFDLLLLDVHLEGELSGLELLHRLRSMPQYLETPAIAIAYNTDGFTEEDALHRAGFDGFLRKPFSIVELLDTVDKLTAT